MLYFECYLEINKAAILFIFSLTALLLFSYISNAHDYYYLVTLFNHAHDLYLIMHSGILKTSSLKSII